MEKSLGVFCENWASCYESMTSRSFLSVCLSVCLSVLNFLLSCWMLFVWVWYRESAPNIFWCISFRSILVKFNRISKLFKVFIFYNFVRTPNLHLTTIYRAHLEHFPVWRNILHEYICSAYLSALKTPNLKVCFLERALHFSSDKVRV
jgi:hypothetical protein